MIMKRKKEAEQYGRFLKMIDDLQTLYTKPIKIRVLPLLFQGINNNEATYFFC